MGAWGAGGGGGSTTIVVMGGGESIVGGVGHGVTDVDLTAGAAVALLGTGHLTVPDGSEALAAALVGISADAFTHATPATYAPQGTQLTGLAGLTPQQELWAGTGGALVPWSSVPSGWWTRPMAVVDSTTSLRVQIGPVVQHP